VSNVVAQLADGRGPVTIVCFGDSITGLYYHTGGRRAWCDMLGIGLNKVYPTTHFEMVNAGESGETTFNALKRIRTDVLAKRPRLVVVMFGMNDVARVSPSDYHKNLVRIVEQCRTVGAVVILCTPNPIYPQDLNRPVGRLAEFADIVRQVGAECHVLIADCYRRLDAIRAESGSGWMALMSETVHPNMRGHIVIAEEVTRAVTGRRITLRDVPPLFPSIPHTLTLLSKHLPMRVLAMTPYDCLIERTLLEIDADARVEVIPWRVAGKSLAEIEEEGNRRNWLSLRPISPNEKPDLVIVAVPSSATAPTPELYYRSYTGILNSCFSFAGFKWDVIAILPSVRDGNQTSAQMANEELALTATKGHDMGWIERPGGDSNPGHDIVFKWLRSQAGSARNSVLRK